MDIALIIGFISMLLTVLFFIVHQINSNKGRYTSIKRSLYYEVLGVNLVNNLGVIDDLVTLYKNKKITNLSTTYISFWNPMKLVQDETHFRDGIIISVPKDNRIYDLKLIKKTDENAKLMGKQKTNSEWLIIPSYISPLDSITVVVVHDTPDPYSINLSANYKETGTAKLYKSHNESVLLLRVIKNLHIRGMLFIFLCSVLVLGIGFYDVKVKMLSLVTLIMLLIGIIIVIFILLNVNDLLKILKEDSMLTSSLIPDDNKTNKK